MTWECHNRICPDRPPDSVTEEAGAAPPAMEQALASEEPPTLRRTTEEHVALDLVAIGKLQGSSTERSPESRRHAVSPPIITGSQYRWDEGTLGDAAYEAAVAASAVKPEQPPGASEADAGPREHLSSAGLPFGSYDQASTSIDFSFLPEIPAFGDCAPLLSSPGAHRNPNSAGPVPADPTREYRQQMSF